MWDFLGKVIIFIFRLLEIRRHLQNFNFKNNVTGLFMA